jgi:hypothetical protein
MLFHNIGHVVYHVQVFIKKHFAKPIGNHVYDFQLLTLLPKSIINNKHFSTKSQISILFKQQHHRSNTPTFSCKTTCFFFALLSILLYNHLFLFCFFALFDIPKFIFFSFPSFLLALVKLQRLRE